MKIRKEMVLPDPGQSFRLFRPRLRNNFYWHYHPEYELVLVEAVAGIRHVGQHISSFTGSDLVLIGSNIPHLNFDYGIKTTYHQIVVQLRENFMGDAFRETPEFSAIDNLLKRSAMGLSFLGETKRIVAGKLKAMQGLNHFRQLISLLEVLQVLALSDEYIQLNDRDTSVRLFLNDKIRMGFIYRYIHSSYNQHCDVNEVAAGVHLSTPAFCRFFKKQTRMTFTEFVNQYRIIQAKTMLLNDINVSETCYEVGFESLSYFNKLFKKHTGMNPSAFRKNVMKSDL